MPMPTTTDTDDDDNDNDTRWTEHDCIGSLPNEPKSRKVVCVPNGTEMLSNKATTNKNMLSQTLSRKQFTIICQKKRQNT